MADKPSVVNEWIITDAESLRAAVDGMRRKRRLSLEDLFHRTKGRMAAAFIQRRKDNLRSDTIINVVTSLEFELVIREPSTSKSSRRLATLRAEHESKSKEAIRQAIEEQVSGSDRDAEGKLTRPLTEQERLEVEALLDEYSKS
jgi:hypothetical protein